MPFLPGDWQAKNILNPPLKKRKPGHNSGLITHAPENLMR
jgi:hypothetical protein